MKKLFFIFVCCSTMLWAQEKTVKGTVSDAQGAPLPGVNVIVDGTTNGTQSDFDGLYTIKVAKGDLLVFSFIGMLSQKVVVGDTSTINIVLQEDAAQLDEVVVVGYGTQAKKDITGSVAVVSAEAITERSVSNISNALQGATSGVVVTRTTAAPGGGNTIRIRGNTTLQGSNEPLILVDDIPVGSINEVAPDQVESISILKDGAASAIYGSRAAAGVIIITTKRAKDGIFRLSYSGEYFINTPTQNRADYADAVNFMQLENEVRWNDTGNEPDGKFGIWTEAQIAPYLNGQAASAPDTYPNHNWADTMIKKQSTGTRHNISIAGGSEKVKTNFSIGYEEQDALYVRRDWRRYVARLNNDFKLSDKFGAIADISFRLIKDEQPQPSSGEIFQQALTIGPIYPVLWQDGRLATGRDNGNPYAALLNSGFRNNDSYLFRGKIGAFYKPIKDLKISLNLSPSFSFSKFKSFVKPIFVYALDDVDQTNPIASSGTNRIGLAERRSNTNSITTQALINYNKAFGKHGVELLGGFEEFSQQSETLGVTGDNFVSPDFPYLNQAPTDQVKESGTRISELAYRSVFGRLNYNFDDKYYISGVLRSDGSSRFGSDYRWGTFPSVSAAWTVSNENFMKPIADKVSFLKLKASYGSLGNDRLGNYLYLTQLQVGTTLILNGASPEEIRNVSQRFLTTPNITWETTISKNFGIELGVFDNRLSLEGEYFIKDTEDMLLSLSVPDLVGFEDPVVNVGAMQTKGWDFNASWRDRVGEDFNYGISFNLSNAKSIIGNINDKRLFSGITLSEEGHQFRELYGYLSDGLFQTQDDVDNSPVVNSAVGPGDVKYKDISGPDGEPDGVINSFDRTFLGSSLPQYTFGGRMDFAYKGFDLNIAFQGVGKFNYRISGNDLQGGNSLNFSQEYINGYWSLNKTEAERQNAIYPRLSNRSRSNNFRFSDFWIRNGAYLKIKTLALGYTIPTSALKNSGLSNIKLTLAANDFFTFDNLPKGFDPEQSATWSYYLTKSVVLGLKVNF